MSPADTRDPDQTARILAEVRQILEKPDEDPVRKSGMPAPLARLFEDWDSPKLYTLRPEPAVNMFHQSLRSLGYQRQKTEYFRTIDGVMVTFGPVAGRTGPTLTITAKAGVCQDTGRRGSWVSVSRCPDGAEPPHQDRPRP